MGKKPPLPAAPPKSKGDKMGGKMAPPFGKKAAK